MPPHVPPLSLLGFLPFILQAPAEPRRSKLPSAAVERFPTPGRGAPAALSPKELADGERVRAAYERIFGAPVSVWVSSGGRVGLPLPRQFNATEIAVEWAWEQLDTEARRERATLTFGGLPLGGPPLGAFQPQPSPAYGHFWGVDDPDSDIWADPDFLIQFFELAQSWRKQCSETIIPSDSGRCMLQLGDLSWYEDIQPDPLGHKDHRGNCVDIRLFRTDAFHYEAYWNRPDDRPPRPDGIPWGGYDRALTQAFVDHARSLKADPIFFNDPEVRGVEALPGHDDHLHLCFPISP